MVSDRIVTTGRMLGIKETFRRMSARRQERNGVYGTWKASG